MVDYRFKLLPLFGINLKPGYTDFSFLLFNQMLIEFILIMYSILWAR